MRFSGAVLRAIGRPIEVETLSLVDMAKHDVLVRVMATSLCHTDLEVIDGQLSVRLPVIPGHEAAGIVEWVGKDVQRSKVGDHVILSWNPNCGTCFYCLKQQPILCGQYRGNSDAALHFDGHPRIVAEDGPVHQLMYTGAFAEFAVVTESCAIPVSKDIPFDRACLIGCGVMTGVGAVLNVARVEAGSSVSVIGCGSVGLSAIQGARLATAAPIVAIDIDSSKLALARTMGATHTLLAQGDWLDMHRAATFGRGADFVFEAAGSQAAFAASLEIVRPGGQVVWLGKRPTNEHLSLRWGSLMAEKKIVRASYGGAHPSRDFPMLAKAYLDGTLMLDEYITSRIRLADLNSAMDRLRAGNEIRAVIEF